MQLPTVSALPAGLVLSGMKRAEAGDAIILRVYEAFGQANALTLPAGFVVEETQTDEQQVLAQLPCSPDGCTVPFAPYEIKTLRLRKV